MHIFKKNEIKNKDKSKTNGFFKDKIKKVKKMYQKKIVKNGSKYSVKEVVMIMFITFLFGMIIGGVIMFGKGMFNSDINDSLDEFVDTYQDILDTYYEEVDAEALLQAGISGMIDYLGDPYSTYMDAELADSFDEEVEGIYAGIGAMITYRYSDDALVFGEIYEKSPAEKAGIRMGDILLAVDGNSVAGFTTADVANVVKGKVGTEVKIKFKRGNEEFETVIVRDKVDIESVETKIYEENKQKIGYIKISIFASNTYKQFKNKLELLEKEGFDKLVIDVRNNSGGYLTTVTDIISLFTEKGSIIYQLNTKGKIEKIKDVTKDFRDYPIYVLTNQASASASEVLAAAIKENYGGKTIGVKTYGKGKVQKAYDLSNGAKIKYTFQEWLTPKGNSIDSVGVAPDIVVENVIDKTDNDNQLIKAIKEITK